MSVNFPIGGPSPELIEAMARDAIRAMPDGIRAHLDAVVLKVEEFADRATLDQLGLTDPMTLSGLYTGRPLGDKSVHDSGSIPDMIQLYRHPILAEARAEGIAVERLVAHVLIHEVGHHFGFSDAYMHAILDTDD